MYETYYECLGGMYSTYKKPSKWKDGIKEFLIGMSAIILLGFIAFGFIGGVYCACSLYHGLKMF